MIVCPAMSIQAARGARDDGTRHDTAPRGEDGAGRSTPGAEQRFLEAARGLMWEAGSPSFTVTQVVAAAGSSLKSFYRCFASKDELLVSLFADDARRGAAALAAMIEAEPGPERLRTAVVGLFRFITLDGRLPYAAALVGEHLRLAESRPEELRSVMAPFVALFACELARAQERGETRPGDPARDARTLFHIVTSHLHALVFHQIDESPGEVADELWAFCSAALRPEAVS